MEMAGENHEQGVVFKPERLSILIACESLFVFRGSMAVESGKCGSQGFYSSRGRGKVNVVGFRHGMVRQFQIRTPGVRLDGFQVIKRGLPANAETAEYGEWPKADDVGPRGRICQ